jgi:hypothetical protein
MILVLDKEHWVASEIVNEYNKYIRHMNKIESKNGGGTNWSGNGSGSGTGDGFGLGIGAGNGNGIGSYLKSW